MRLFLHLPFTEGLVAQAFVMPAPTALAELPCVEIVSQLLFDAIPAVFALVQREAFKVLGLPYGLFDVEREGLHSVPLFVVGDGIRHDVNVARSLAAVVDEFDTGLSADMTRDRSARLAGTIETVRRLALRILRAHDVRDRFGLCCPP
jgi:hypothetical protein